MGRKTKEELKEITKKYNVNRLWSWSKFNTYHNSPYEYYLKYIIKKPEDRQDCIYTTTGGMAHDIMENLYMGKIEYENMDSDFEDAWITANIAELMTLEKIRKYLISIIKILNTSLIIIL